MEHISKSETETAALAAKLADDMTPGTVLLLDGPLGAGKSVFARALIRALSDSPALAVPSPTFTLVQTYDTPRGPVWHFDLYRLEEPEEIYELGWEDALAGAITLVEWPRRLGMLAPADALTVSLNVTDNPSQRRIMIGHTQGETERHEL